MGRRGPPRLPESVRARRGTLRNDRTNHAAPDLEHGRPRAPEWLSGDAQAEWRRMVPILDRAGLLTLSGRAALVGYCTAWGELAEAQRTMLAEGSTILGDDGVPRISPQVKRAKEAREQLLKFGREFGMTPAAAASVKAGPSGKDREGAARRRKFALVMPRGAEA